MQPSWQIPRPALFWLLATQVILAALQFAQLPLWLLLAGALVLGWRVQIYRGRWRYPGSLAKAALVATCGGAILVDYGRIYGLEPMVALLWSGFILKLLEMHERRDALILVALGYFVAASHCLFYQTPAAAAAMVAGTLLVTVVLAALFRRPDDGLWRPLGTATLLLLEAVPLMLLLFLVMPRLGSLWTVPTPTAQGVMGIDDQLSPGDLGQLGISDAIAFRVEFEGQPPPRNQLYWRGLVLSRFDGRGWNRIEPWGQKDSQPRRGGGAPQPWESRIERLGEALRYQTIIEPTGKPWLFALATPLPEDPEVLLQRDLTLNREQPVTARWSYRVRSWPEYRVAAESLSATRRALETALPGNGNPRARELASRLRGQAQSTTDFIDLVLARYREAYIYSLQAPTLGRDAIDEFLFDTRKGFCEHFAGSFAFLMRAAGIPARVVVGYQGGEYHPSAGYLILRQYDAHAWAEVWLQDRGWVRVDPTAAVAPERIETSVSELLGTERSVLADSPLATGGLGGASWFSRFRLRLDYYDYLWAKWVLGYELRQEQLLRGWLGGWDPWRVGIFVLAAGAVALLPVVFGQLRGGRRPRRPPLEKLFERYCRKLARRGLVRRTGEGPRSLARRAAREQPALTARVEAISGLFEDGLYGSGEVDTGALRRRIRQL